MMSVYCQYFVWILHLSWIYLEHILRWFLRRFLRGCIAVCAVTSPSHRRIASAAHRIGGASHRCTKRRRLANFIRIKGAADSLHADWRSGASTTAGSGRRDDEDICRSHGRKVVTRWSSKSYAMHRPMRSIELKHCTGKSTQKTQKIKPRYAVLCTIP